MASPAPPTYAIRGISLGGTIPKASFVRRYGMESDYAHKLVEACAEFESEVILSAKPSASRCFGRRVVRKHAWNDREHAPSAAARKRAAFEIALNGVLSQWPPHHAAQHFFKCRGFLFDRKCLFRISAAIGGQFTSQFRAFVQVSRHPHELRHVSRLGHQARPVFAEGFSRLAKFSNGIAARIGRWEHR